MRSPSTLRSGYPLELHRLCGEVDSEPIPPQQVRPEEDLLSWHKGGLCEEGLPIKGEIGKIEIFLHVLPAPEGDLDTANEPGVDGLAQVVGQFQLPIEARINSRGQDCPATVSRSWGTPSSVTVPVSTAGIPSGGRRRCQSGENTGGW